MLWGTEPSLGLPSRSQPKLQMAVTTTIFWIPRPWQASMRALRSLGGP